MECLRSFADANEGSTDVDSLADALACIQLGNPAGIASIWMVTGGGEVRQHLPRLPHKLNYPEDSWKGLFREVGGNFRLPLTGDFPAR